MFASSAVPKFPDSSFQAMLNLVLAFTLLLSSVTPLLQAPPNWAGIARQGGTRPVSRTVVDKPVAFDRPQVGLTARQDEPEIPTVWRGFPEVVDRRQAGVRHYDMGDGRFAAVVDAAQGESGPRFRAVDGGYRYEHEGLSVGLGGTTSAALFKSGESLIGWQPQSLLALDGQGRSIASLA
jgi:hypothetical protein